MRDIAGMGWPVGRVLGNETALVAHYRVSRAVLREAVRQLEQRGVARMQRGRGGGLRVALPVDQAAVRAIAGYLEATVADLATILEAQYLLEVEAAELAAERIDQDRALALRAMAAGLPAPTGDPEIDAPPHTELRAAIAEAAGNPVLALFIRALNLSSIEIRSMLVAPAVRDDYIARVERSIADKSELVEAIVGVDPRRARTIVERDMRAQMALFVRLSATDVAPRGLMRGDDPLKLAQALMLRMAEDVARAAATPGTRLGSEAEMLERYGVSRAVFREALRLLEQHGVVRMRRGVGGGLFVGTPDMTRAILMAVDHFRQMALPTGALREVRAALQLGLIDLVVARISLRDMPELEAVRSADDLARLLARLSGNPVLELLLGILIEADPWSSMEKLATETARAIIQRDAAFARRAITACSPLGM